MQKLKRFWALVGPFWLHDSQRVRFWILLGLVLGLSLSSVWFSVKLNVWNGDFFNAIQALDGEKIYSLLIDFVGIIAVFIIVLVYTDWLRKKLEIEWRERMTQDFLKNWLSKTSSHYRLQLLGEPDNPDQRVAEDIRFLIEDSLQLVISFLRSLLTLISFISILWALSGPLSLEKIGLNISIPGYMVWVAVIWTLIANVITHAIGKPLMKLNFEQQRREADFRYALMQDRSHADSIAGSQAEEREIVRLGSFFEHLKENWVQLMNKEKQLGFFTIGYAQVNQLAPIFFALPPFLAGTIGLGGLTQIRMAFGQVSSALSWFLFAYKDIARWSATVDRLYNFASSLEKANTLGKLTESKQKVHNLTDSATLLRGEVTVLNKDKTPLLTNIALNVKRGTLTVLMGESGTGKSTLLKVLSGFWPQFEGSFTKDATSFWMPQGRWIPPLKLMDVLHYPNPKQEITKNEAKEHLKELNLTKLIKYIDNDEVCDWSQILSGGEAQRLLLARLVTQKPDLMLLDEATSALDDENTLRAIKWLRKTLKDSAILFVSHQAIVAQNADTVIRVEKGL